MATTNKAVRTAGKSGSQVYLKLASIYLAMVLLRAILAVTGILYPRVMIDEMLYCNIARSIANGEGLLFMGQQADYSYILYPLVLAPVYAIFPYGANFYNIIQCWNAALMGLSVFPIFALAKAITNNQNKALGIAFLSLLMPDFILNGYILSESIVYPLFFVLIYCVYQYICAPKTARALLIGVLGALLYQAKPGHIAPAAVALGLCLVWAIRKKELRFVWHFLSGAVAMALLIGAFALVLRFGFSQQSESALSIYSSQVSYDASRDAETLKGQAGAFLKGVFLSPYYVFLASGGLVMMLPFMFRRQMSADRQTLLNFSAISLGVTIIGTAWVVNRPEYGTFLIHMRYYAMYIPLFLMLGLADGKPQAAYGKKKHEPDKRCGIPMVAFLAYIVLCSLAFGVKSGIHERISMIVNLSVGVIRAMPDGIALISSIVLALLCALLYWLVRKWQYSRLRTLSVALLALCLLANNIANYASLDSDADVVNASAEASEALAGEDFVMVIRSSTLTYYSLLDVNSKNTNYVITINDLFNNLSINHGVYRPHVPEQYRGMAAVSETPDIKYLALDASAYRFVKLSGAAQALTDEAGALVLIKIPRGERCADSVMGGVLDYTLPRTATGYIRVFDTEVTSGRLTLDIDVDVASELTISCGSQTETLVLAPGRADYTLELTGPTLGVISFQSNVSSVNIYGYGIEPLGD